MKKTALILVVVLFLMMAHIQTLFAAPPTQEGSGTCTISSPGSGVTLRGSVPIIGTVTRIAEQIAKNTSEVDRK